MEKHLKSKGQGAPELHLLHCLELIQLGDKNPAGKALKQYSTHLTEVKSSRAHPLYLLARARLSDQEEEIWSLVTKFAELYPEAVDKVAYLADVVVTGSLLISICLYAILCSHNIVGAILSAWCLTNQIVGSCQIKFCIPIVGPKIISS